MHKGIEIWSARVDISESASTTERPDPPTDLELTDQKRRSVQLTWTPGDEHNSPIESMCSVCVCAARELRVAANGTTILKKNPMSIFFIHFRIGC